MNSIDKDPSACPHCEAARIKYGPRYNKKGKTQTCLCKGPKPHRFTFNPGFEKRHYSNATISKALCPYPKMRSVGKVVDELKIDGEKPHPDTSSRWIQDIVWKVVESLKKIDIKGIGDVWSTDRSGNK